MHSINDLIDEMAGVLDWLGIDTQNPEELFGIADAFAWIPIWDGGNGDRYDAALCSMKNWGQRMLDYLTDEHRTISVPDENGQYHDVDKSAAFQTRPLGLKPDPHGLGVQPILRR